MDGDTAWMMESGRDLVQELCCKMRYQGLRPKTIVDYTREPFIYRPGNVVITNGLQYLPPDSEIFENLRQTRPDANIYLTEHQHVVFSVDRDGKVCLEQGPEPCHLF